MVLKCQKNSGEEEAVSIMDLQDLKKKGKSFTIIIHNRFINCSKTRNSMCYALITTS